MYRPIVINPMRTSNNVRSAIVAPEFTNMTLYNDCYRLTISLHISEEVFNRLVSSEMREAKPICYRGRKYLHWEKSFYYDVKFWDAYAEAETALRHMKVIIREAKIHILEDEIDVIKYWD